MCLYIIMAAKFESVFEIRSSTNRGDVGPLKTTFQILTVLEFVQISSH